MVYPCTANGNTNPRQSPSYYSGTISNEFAPTTAGGQPDGYATTEVPCKLCEVALKGADCRIQTSGNRLLRSGFPCSRSCQSLALLGMNKEVGALASVPSGRGTNATGQWYMSLVHCPSFATSPPCKGFPPTLLDPSLCFVDESGRRRAGIDQGERHGVKLRETFPPYPNTKWLIRAKNQVGLANCKGAKSLAPV